MKKILLAILIIGSFLNAQGVIQEKNSCLQFDGVDDYVKVYNSASLNFITKTGTYTFECWIYTRDITGVVRPSLIMKSPSQSDRNVLGYNGGYICMGYYDDTWKGISGPLTIGEWIHAVGINNGGNLSLYLNGVLQTGTQIPYAAAPPELYIGWSGLTGSGEYWKGLIDEVRIYSRALSADEIYYNYTHRQPYSKDSLKLWLKMDEGTGTVAYDSSGYGNNGTLYNGVSWRWESPFIAARQ